MVEAIRAAALGELPHGFLTRTGEGALGEREEASAAAAVLPGAPVIRPKQVHSPDCMVVDAPWHGAPPEADAVVTAVPGVLIGVITADCAPVLLADREGGVVGAAHAGWRGAHAGVIENTVAAMESLGARAERIAAAIGPCIAQPSYEVDAAFREAFGAEDERFFVPGRADHWQFDLEGYVADRLVRAGVGRVERMGLDTYADPERFHSYRRATHRGTADKGRQLSLIGL
ncbi:MAG: peptidoglycan editing factor PgeF [Tsuneonella sp.]